MEITKKIKSLVGRQGSVPLSGTSDGSVDHSAELAISRYKAADHRPLPVLNDPEAEEAILKTIESIYYSDETFDAGEYELKKLPEELDLNRIHVDRKILRKQLQVVSKKVSELILKNQPAYTEELQRVTELKVALEEATAICSSGRKSLGRARRDFTAASLGILASCRKREQLRSLLKSLHLIKTLQATDVTLRELLEEEDYPGAIQLCLECQKAASTFGHFKCISDLSSKLQDTLEMTEEQLDVALSKVCSNFDKVHYEKLQAAYRHLGKTQTAMDQLLMHFTSAIHNKAFNIVLGYVELCVGSSESNFQKRQYAELCKSITSDCFIPCLMDLCKALWEVMYSYKSVMEWHSTQEDYETPSEDGEQMSEADYNFTRRYVQQKLEHGLLRVWQDVQHKIKTYVLSCDLSSFKFDEFIQVLDLVRRLIEIGEEFCQSKSEDLQESLRKQSVNYFKNYHRICLEEMKEFLENESWELVPVRADFSIIQLQEFRFFRNSRQIRLVATSEKLEPSPCPPQSSPLKYSYFQKYGMHGNPFLVQAEEEEEDVINYQVDEDEKAPKLRTDYDSDDSDVPEELKKDYVDEQTGEVPQKKNVDTVKTYTSDGQSPFITNTTLNMLRLFGKYMNMMDVLKTIAFDVLICMSQILDYYMYTVYLFFAKEMSEFSENALSNKLRTALRRIKENLILEELDSEFADPSRVKDHIPPPTLSPMVDLKTTETLFGLSERVVAAESLVFLAAQFEFLNPHLEALIPPAKRSFLQTFFTQTVALSPELRRPIYMTVAARAVDYDQIINYMISVKWEIHDIMSQHSYYVDVLVRELQVFIMRLFEVSKRTPIPKEASDLLWEHCIRIANRSFIEGFSQAKKCTNEGRALMQLDYQQFITKVEKLTDLRPLPDKDLVEGYIKAYYLLEGALETWIQSHTEYTPKQLLGLVNCVTQINKKGRQRLISLIEENDRLKR